MHVRELSAHENTHTHTHAPCVARVSSAELITSKGHEFICGSTPYLVDLNPMDYTRTSPLHSAQIQDVTKQFCVTTKCCEAANSCMLTLR